MIAGRLGGVATLAAAWVEGMNTGAEGRRTAAATCSEAAGIGGAAGGGTTGADTTPGASGAGMRKIVAQVLQRDRTPAAGTLAGSTRYTVSHDGQRTFTR